MKHEPVKRIFRSFALSLSSFNYLKAYQRNYQEAHRVSITNNQTLGLILADHQHNSEGDIANGS